jgi:3-dehydroquinate synthase
MKKITVNLKDRSYDILIGKGALGRLPQALKGILGTPKVLLVTTPSINKLYGKKVIRLLKQKKIEVTTLLLPEGERAKSEKELFRIYAAALKAGLDRSSGIIALGGGAIGDVAGFAASTYLRGVSFVNLPTTLLAQVDSAIGGKTAINLKAGKNLAGTFHQPSLVISDLNFLKTLPAREYISSLAEVVKYGVIASPSLFQYLEKNVKAVLKREEKALLRIITESSKIKAEVVEADEKELTGLRAILNYGHTFAHAYEKACSVGKVSHGEAVGIGMCDAARLAEKKKLLSKNARIRIESLVAALDLKIDSSHLKFSKATYKKAMTHDKKKKGSQVYFILPERIGHVKPVGLNPSTLK